MNEALRSEAIVLDDQYFYHLREAAYDWAIESVDDQPAGPRRAAIVLGRNVVSLVDEVRRLRAQLKTAREWIDSTAWKYWRDVEPADRPSEVREPT